MFGREFGSVWGMIARAKHVALAGALMAVIGYGCAPSATMSRPRRDFSMISHEDLVSTHYNSAYDAVQALHSNWLITRPNSVQPQSQVLVYLDNVTLGGISELSNVPISGISYIRYFDAVDATTRWGLGHTQAVIYISTHPKGSAADPGL